MRPFCNTKDISIKAVIFDMDGVVFDSERTWARFDGEADRVFGTGFGPHVRDMFCGMDEAAIRFKLRALRPELDADAYREYIISHVHDYEKKNGARLKPGFTELYAALKRNKLQVALATSSSRERVERLVKKAGLDMCIFDAVVCREDVKKAKPDPEIFLKAAEAVRTSPDKATVIEDSPNGLEAAVAGGFMTVMVPDLIPPPDRLVTTKSITVVKSLKDVIALLHL